MGFWNRIKLIASSNANAALDSAEDPEKILEQLIRDMRKQLQEAKKQVAVAVADEKRLEKQLRDETMKAQDWEKKAMLAVRAGNDELARQALGRKAEHEGLANDYKTQYEGQHQATENLRAQLRQLHDKIEEAQRKKNMLIARHKRAKAQKKIAETMSGLSDTSAFDTFDRMATRVDDAEAKAAAEAELSNDLGLGGDNLADQFKDLERNAGQDDALAALKAKMSTAEAKPMDAPAALPPASAGMDDIEAQLAALKAKG